MDRLFHGDWFLEDEAGGRIVQFVSVTRSADDDERHRIPDEFVFDATEKGARATKIAVHDKSVDLGFSKLLTGALGLGFDLHADVQAAQNALQNADFRPITRNEHR